MSVLCTIQNILMIWLLYEIHQFNKTYKKSIT